MTRFTPRFMKVGILTAALQELTPRAQRDADPDRAIEDWLSYARELGADYIQLSAALHPSESDVPPEANTQTSANGSVAIPFERAKLMSGGTEVANIASSLPSIM